MRKKEGTMPADGKDLYGQWVGRLWNGPSSADQLRQIAADLVTEDFVGPWPGQDVRGPDGLADLIAETKKMFADLAFEIEVDPLAEADMVAGRWIGTGTMTDGAASRFFGNDILRLREGRFCEYWVASAEG
jgi:hypothetical protein